MDTGWVKIHRKLLENPIMQKPAYLSLWVTLLLRANHKQTKMIWNNQMIVIKEGQFITGRDALSKQTGIHRSSIERILEYLENEHQIEQQKTTKYRLITIVNWETHQKESNTLSNKRATNEQQASTNKNDNNEKNLDTGLSLLKNPTKELLEEMTTRFKADEPQIKAKINSLVDYCEQHGRRYKNYKSFLCNALRKDYGERPEKKTIPKYEIINGKAVLVDNSLA